MASADDIPILDRPSFFDGQRLTAADLTALQTFHRELRWLHTRSLHGWGIAFGYAVSGKAGDRSVRITPGYAVDCNGRDLIQSQPLELAIPAVAGAPEGGPIAYYLTASYAEDSRLPAQTQSGTCGTSGAVRRSEQPMIRWQDPNNTDADSRYRRGEDVILAAIEVQNCQLLKDVSLAERRDAVPAQQPYIAAGQTQAGETDWQLFPNDDNPVGVKAFVSTSSAGFRATPRYQAHVVGQRLATVQEDDDAERHFIVDGYAQVAQATAGSFELQVILPSGTTAGAGLSYEITSDDFNSVIEAIVSRLGGTPSEQREVEILVRQSVAQRIVVGQEIQLIEFGRNEVRAADFNVVLDQIADNASTTVDRLLSDNGLTRATMALSVGDRLISPNAALSLNPPDLVFQESFLTQLKSTLDWYVVWMGIEG